MAEMTIGNIDFGARIYEKRLGKWLAVDPSFSSYPDISPYVSFVNCPISFIDPDGKDVIIIIYAGGEFSEAAMTQKNEIEQSQWFNPARDHVYMFESSSWDNLQNEIDNITSDASQNGYGKTTQATIFSHCGGLDGPVGAEIADPACRIPGRQQKGQMAPGCWASLEFNFDKDRSVMVFEGCRSAAFAANFLTYNKDVRYTAGHGGYTSRSESFEYYDKCGGGLFSCGEAYQIEPDDDGFPVPYALYERHGTYPTYDRSSAYYRDPSGDTADPHNVVSSLGMDPWGLYGHSASGYQRVTTEDEHHSNND